VSKTVRVERLISRQNAQNNFQPNQCPPENSNAALTTPAHSQELSLFSWVS
jgi:hypothetical protein